MLCFTNIVLMLCFFRSDKRMIPFPIEKQSVMSWSYYMNFKDIYSINVIFIIVFAVDVCVCNIMVSSSLIIFMNKFDLHNRMVFLLVSVDSTLFCTCTFQQYIFNKPQFLFYQIYHVKKNQSLTLYSKCKVTTILCK